MFLWEQELISRDGGLFTHPLVPAGCGTNLVAIDLAGYYRGHRREEFGYIIIAEKHLSGSDSHISSAT